MPVILQQLLGAMLGLWAVGAQAHELMSTIGAWATAALTLVAAFKLKAKPDFKIWWPLAAFIACQLICPLLGGAWPTATGFARLSDWLLVPVAAFAVVHVSDRALPRIGLAAAAVLLISCVVAAAQYFGIWPRSQAFASLEWAKLPFYRMDETVPGREDRFMAGGLLLHRLKFANTATLTCVLLVTAAVLKPPYRRVFMAAALLAIPAVVIFPHARAAAVAMVVACLIVIALGLPSRRLAVGVTTGLALGVLLLVGLVSSVRERFAEGLTFEGISEREIITRSGLEAIRAHPFTGEGLGRFRPSLYAPPDSPPAVLEHQGKAHNQFVTIAAEAGLPSALMFVVGLLVLSHRGWQARSGAGLALLGTLALFVGLCLMHDPLFHPGPAMAFMLALGGTAGLIERQRLAPAAASIADARTS